VQEIALQDDYEFFYENFGDQYVDFVDYNFDGNEDVQIIYSQGTGGIWYEVWLYGEGEFHFYEPLISLSNPLLDVETETLFSYNPGGSMGAVYFSKRFQWIDGELDLIWQEKQDMLGDSYDEFVRTVTTYENGVETLECSVKINIEDEAFLVEEGELDGCGENPF
jgi:hypothetical protein